VKSPRLGLAIVLCVALTGVTVAGAIPAVGVTPADGTSSTSLGIGSSQPANVAGVYGSSSTVADHGEEYGDEEIIEVQKITTADAEQGRVRVELGYHIGSEIARLQIAVQESIELVGLDGFSAVEDQQNTYAWDQETTQPSITISRNGDRSVQPFGGLDYTRTDEWLLTNPVPTYVQWWATNPDSIERHTVIQSPENGYEGQEMLYVGNYEQFQFESAREQFTVIVTGATTNVSVERLETALRVSSEMFDVGARSDDVTAFVVTDPVRTGGLARGPDFWVHESGLAPPRTTLWHEYVHTRQAYEPGESVEWTIEGSAEYYAKLLALRQGQIQYHDYHASLSKGDESYPDVVLGDSETWKGTRGDYRVGSLALATLDGKIREESGGSGTLEDVFRRMNRHDGDLTAEIFEGFVGETAGTSLDDFFESHVDSSAGNLTVPPPSRYDVPGSDTTLQVEVTDARLEPGERGSIQFQVQNTGSQTSLAPYLDVAVPSELNGGDPTVNTTAGTDSRITAVDGGWTFDHLEPGETLVVEYEVLVPEVAPIDDYTVESTVADLGGNQARKNTAVEVTSTPSAALVADSRPSAGETTVLDASGSTDRVAIENYRWEITGPDGNLTETTEPTLEYAFPEPGEYTVTLTVVNELGRTDSVDRTVIVNDRPEVSVDAPSTARPGDAVRVSVNVTNDIGEYEVVWSVGDQSATGDSAEFTFPEAGDYEVSVTVSDEYGLTATETVTVSVSEVDGDETATESEDSETASDDETGEAGEETAADDGVTAGEDGAGFGVAVALAGLGCCLLAVRHRLA
jgi:PKD repeat protein